MIAHHGQSDVILPVNKLLAAVHTAVVPLPPVRGQPISLARFVARAHLVERVGIIWVKPEQARNQCFRCSAVEVRPCQAKLDEQTPWGQQPASPGAHTEIQPGSVATPEHLIIVGRIELQKVCQFGRLQWR